MKDKKSAALVFDAYQQKQYATAKDLVSEEIQQQPDDIDLKVLHAWILIKSGKSASTYPTLIELAKQHPGHTPTQELAAFSAFLNGKKKQSQSLLQAIDPKRLSDAGWMIRGYGLQAAYKLTAARWAYLKALELNPQNLGARIQLATLYFASDQHELARTQVERSLKQQPDFQPALSLKGFLHLSENDTAAAISSWEKSLQHDDSNAETYFGLSLAKMRQGHIHEAMQHIASAVLLDPQRSMYLSYWAKMLHQVGRHDKALTVLGSAIRLDGQDPTPRLYRAIILRDLNRPGEAIADIQAAMALNDNRGVYRSRSLLDQDLAIQNVDLSRLFIQLGLADWAHKKAMDSIKSDFTNASARIFNAGAFAAQQDRGYALANETLLARMLQPANINTFSSFNGYTSLYESPDTELDLLLKAGNQGQRSAGLVATGAEPEYQVAWSVAALVDDTDGWRDSNAERIDNLSVVSKWQPSRQNSFLFGLSATESELLDDINPRFEFDAPVDPLARSKLSTVLLELGLHRRIDSSHDLLVYVSHLDSDGNDVDNVIDSILTSSTSGALLGTQERIVDSDFERPHTLFQLQGIKKYQSHQFIYGFLSLNGKFSALTSSDFGTFDANHVLNDPLTALDSRTNFNLDINLTSLYLQDSWQINPSLQLDIAAYMEQLDNANAVTGGEWDINESTARLGLIWKMDEHSTFRIASFEYLLPLAIARLDPTDIAGVPIFKNTNEGSLVQEHDLVWDYEWDSGLLSTTLFAVEESFTSATPDNSGVQVESTLKGEKQGLMVTLNQLLNAKTGLNIGLNNFDLEDESLPTANRNETALSVGATYVAGNGLALSATQIYRDMNFDSAREDETINVTNVRLSYEFPGKRHKLDFQVFNLTDEHFNWVTDEFSSFGIAPERLLTLQYSVSF